MNSYYSSSSWQRDQKERMQLRREGFSEQEIDRLCRLHRKYRPDRQDRLILEPDRAHLLFLRWLVTTGKLTR